MRKSLANYYAEDMYERDRTRDSARILVPMVVELIHPSSVVDVGCGRGAWLGEFKAQGIDKIVGLDGDYLKPSMLRFPPQCFRPTDLSSKFEIPRRPIRFGDLSRSRGASAAGQFASPGSTANLSARRWCCSRLRLPARAAKGTSIVSRCPIGGKYLRSWDSGCSIRSGPSFATIAESRGGIDRTRSCSCRRKLSPAILP